MSSYKVRLNDEEEGVSPPWEAYYHEKRKRKFYMNRKTNESIWEHPSTKVESKPKKVEAPKMSERRKRRGNDDEPATQNKMEFDVPIPSTIQSSAAPIDNDEPKQKRKRGIEETDMSHVLAGKFVKPDVAWKDHVKSRRCIPYRGVAILDTNVLLEMPNIANLTTAKQILTVIPFAVMAELDGLKRNDRVRHVTSKVTKQLNELNTDHYFEMETSEEQQVTIPNYHVTTKEKDDIILKCALRVCYEFVSTRNIFNLSKEQVVFITNDQVLTCKANAHNLNTTNLTEFLKKIEEQEAKLDMNHRGAAKISMEKRQETQVPYDVAPEKKLDSARKSVEPVSRSFSAGNNGKKRHTPEVEIIAEKRGKAKARSYLKISPVVTSDDVQIVSETRSASRQSGRFQGKKKYSKKLSLDDKKANEYFAQCLMKEGIQRTIVETEANTNNPVMRSELFSNKKPTQTRPKVITMEEIERKEAEDRRREATTMDEEDDTMDYE